MYVSVINDCRDENARGRIIARVGACFNAPVSFIGVGSDKEAAGNLIDVLDAYGSSEGVILCNVAPRNGSERKWGNGTPFCHFSIGKVKLFVSFSGQTLSLISRFKLVTSVSIFDYQESLEKMRASGYISEAQYRESAHTQFRSFDFLPFVAGYICAGNTLPSKTVEISQETDPSDFIWWVDNFGNCKSTILVDTSFGERVTELNTNKGVLPFYRHLSEVPDGTLAVVIGSSGFGDQWFLEIVQQGKSAAQVLKVSSGEVFSLN
ncbi:MAG: hypothetical protein A2664_04535 [Candidatus Taylorbacteria bacterium RIFCSPHIGHO2_01_FULL_46_22b]|uniref:S-adenosyl-l-methionine hydroxide adenosyltransferase C-terminal domain-containing protein n=1 Tax=Candidatus Taylorbacteria bacterium RIFCSPHIGHO2_01_FULL_46_22b TaxID=1802301 RepID=A0A1G2M4B2_9BACT|nr:MAG: hypothetical protein A2664_04535 [Candidatus Taylorbacteria bacterium RIFCSPHIGHO2_01_FULL_46_22b]